MTLVVRKDNVLVVDSACTTELVQHRVQKWKFLGGGTNSVAVMVGNPLVASALLEWYEANDEDRVIPNAAKIADGVAELIAWHGFGSVYRYSTSRIPQLYGDLCAFGVGMDFAYGALHAGASALDAARAAAYYSPYVAAPFTSFSSGGGGELEACEHGE